MKYWNKGDSRGIYSHAERPLPVLGRFGYTPQRYAFAKSSRVYG